MLRLVICSEAAVLPEAERGREVEPFKLSAECALFFALLFYYENDSGPSACLHILSAALTYLAVTNRGKPHEYTLLH